MADKKGHILLVDDSTLMLHRATNALISAGYQVTATADPSGLSQKIRACDLAIIDFHMPMLNGASLVSVLKGAIGPERSCLFYVYTSDADVARDYEKHGFHGVLLKKGDEVALVWQVDAVFRTIELKKLAEKMRRERIKPR
jgi:DNA-binding NarL/FixJ family response regulator